MTKQISDDFWANNFQVLINPDRLTEFWPLKSQTSNEKLNSISRLGIYISIICMMYFKKLWPISIAIIVLFCTDFIHRNNNLTLPETFSEETLPVFTAPTADNPFSNPNVFTDTNAPAGGFLNDPTLKKQVDNYFDFNLFSDVSDVFGKVNSQRQFYTLPDSSGSRNDGYSDFLKWTYSSPPTLKENGINPTDALNNLFYEDLSAKRPIYPNQYVDPVVNKNSFGTTSY